MLPSISSAEFIPVEAAGLERNTPTRVLRREIILRNVTSISSIGTCRGSFPGRPPILTVGLLIAGTFLLATKIYFVSELLVVLAALAVFFSLGTGLVILFVVVHECGKWSVRKYQEASQAPALPLTSHIEVGMPNLALPAMIGANPEARIVFNFRRNT